MSHQVYDHDGELDADLKNPDATDVNIDLGEGGQVLDDEEEVEIARPTYNYSDDDYISDYARSDDEGQEEETDGMLHHYSLELHDRSRHSEDFHKLLQEDNLEVEFSQQDTIINYIKPYDRRVYSREQYINMNASGEIPYTKKCNELHITPSRKIMRELKGKELNLAHYGINETTAVALAAGLVVNNTVTTLNLEDNWIGEKGAAAISFALTEHNKRISRLDVSRNKLGMLGAYSIANIFKSNDTLTELSMSRTNLSNKMTEALMETLATNKHLVKLDLSANNIGPRGADAIGAALLSNSTLKELNLSWNSLGELGGKAIAQAMQSNVVVRSLNMAWNGLGWKGGQAWAKCLNDNDSIQHLDLSNNRIEAQAWPLLVSACKNNEVLNTVVFSGNYMSPEEAVSVSEISEERKNVTVVYDGMEQLLIMAENAKREAEEEAERLFERAAAQKQKAKDLKLKQNAAERAAKKSGSSTAAASRKKKTAVSTKRRK